MSDKIVQLPYHDAGFPFEPLTPLPENCTPEQKLIHDHIASFLARRMWLLSRPLKHIGSPEPQPEKQP